MVVSSTVDLLYDLRWKRTVFILYCCLKRVTVELETNRHFLTVLFLLCILNHQSLRSLLLHAFCLLMYLFNCCFLSTISEYTTTVSTFAARLCLSSPLRPVQCICTIMHVYLYSTITNDNWWQNARQESVERKCCNLIGDSMVYIQLYVSYILLPTPARISVYLITLIDSCYDAEPGWIKWNLLF